MRSTRTWLFVGPAVAVALVALVVLRHDRGLSWQEAPNLVYYGGSLYFYGSEWADDPPAECAPNGEWGGTPPNDVVSVGHLADEKIDETASQGSVRTDGDGSEVFVARSPTMIGHHPAVIWLRPTDGCWVEYHQGPG